jgi:hypothetical protein
LATESNTYNDYSVAATEAEPLISNFSFWLKPQVGNKLFDVNPVETDFGDMMKMGLMKQVNGPEIIHHEANSRFDVPIVNTSATQASVYGTASVGNGDPANMDGLNYIQLSLASHSPSTGPNQYKKSFPRVGQHIMFKNGGEWRIHGKRTSVDGAHRLYLQKVQASMPTLANTITLAGGQYGGDVFIVYTTSYGEGSLGQTEGLVPTSKSYTSYLQTFSNFYKVTDQQLENETYPFTFTNPQTGKSETINFTYPKGINDTEITLGAMIDNGLFLTSKDDGNLTHLDPETGEEEDVTTTQGYIQALELSAQELLYDTTPTIALFDQIGRLRRKLQQGKDCLMWMGYEVRTALESVATQLGVKGGMLYDRQAVDLNVDQVRKGGFTYNFKDLQIMNHAKFGGAPGFKYPNYFVIAPMMKEKDSKTGGPLDAFCILYMKPHGEGTRGHYKIWETGAFAHGKPATDGRAVRKIHMYCRMGMQTVAAGKHILGKPVTLS